jgi:hypothetical protein
MRFIGLAALLLLGGCLEAADLVQERIATGTQYCESAPGTLTPCEDEAEAKAPVQ